MDTSRIASIFERFTTGYHFYLEDLRSGERVELGDPDPWPIGSCFKLAVLVAYFEALVDGSLPPDSLEAETLIPPERFSTGGGVINLLDSSVRLTDRHLLHWMLAASDGTATDVLIEKLGLGRVQQTLLRLAPNSTLSCNLNDMVDRFRTIPGALDCKTRAWTPEDAGRFRRAACELGRTNAVDLAGLALQTFQYLPPPLENQTPVAAYLAEDGDVHGTSGPDGHQDGVSGPAPLRSRLRRDLDSGHGSAVGDLRILRPGSPTADDRGGRGDGSGGTGDAAGAGPKRRAQPGLDAGGGESSPSADMVMDAYARLLNAPRYPLKRSEAFLGTRIRHFGKTGSIGRNYFTADCAVVIASGSPIAAFGYCTEGWRLPAFVVETICGFIGLELGTVLGLEPQPNWDWTSEGVELLLGDL